MKLNDFITKYKGKLFDHDGVSPNQCVDLAKAWIEMRDKGYKTSSGCAWGNAKDYWYSFPSTLKNQGYYKVANSKTFIPLDGDICVFGNGVYGHISVACNSELSNVSYFYSFDQNWTKTNPQCHIVKHSYSDFLGVLRREYTVSYKKGANVRKYANLSSEVVGELPYKSKVKVLDKIGNFYQVEYYGQKRYVHVNMLEA